MLRRFLVACVPSLLSSNVGRCRRTPTRQICSYPAPSGPLRGIACQMPMRTTDIQHLRTTRDAAVGHHVGRACPRQAQCSPAHGLTKGGSSCCGCCCCGCFRDDLVCVRIVTPHRPMQCAVTETNWWRVTWESDSRRPRHPLPCNTGKTLLKENSNSRHDTPGS